MDVVFFFYVVMVEEVDLNIDSDLYCIVIIFSFSGDVVFVFYVVKVEVVDFVKFVAVVCTKEVFNFMMIE